ncbi:ABC transporter ATP-binding protein/permease [Arthrobacter gengyunqii]|uniref:ABC transporter ATP-binding protein/permease n=1 Tax=Arthrobacter gengyunqii TaxID=2886940 RepID=A0A9X1S6K4_9MICC|nr:ABC transporter ATP-binding protein [Arthrobacter gengyunqii]MCC3268439.1 ABC transporter ATP-binding protein/permease [Arthrobacter gengyunqii]UOY95832.1 ABC transporter ATP-binding protein/permease [Arthrobacter gengyunqii]
MPAQTTLWQSLARLYPHLRPILPRLILGLFCALGASLMALAIPQVFRVLINTSLSPGGSTAAVWGAAGVVLGLGILEAGFIALRRQFVIAPATTVETRMRTSFYRHLQDLAVSFHDRWGSGQLLSRAMSDLNLVRRWMAFGAIMLVVTALTVVVGFTIMLFTSWVLALIFMAAAVPIVIYGYRFNRFYRQVSRQSQDQTGDLATTVEESVHGIRVLKAFGRSREALDSFEEQAQELRETEVSKANSLAKFSLVVTLLPEAALAVALVVGIIAVADGNLSIGSLVAFFATAAVVAGPVEAVGPLLSMTLTAKTAIDRHYEVMDAQSSIQSPQRPVHLNDVRGELVFDDVHFAYPDTKEGTRNLIDGVTLCLRPGETMALVGVTGSGKSTLLQLVPRLFDVTGGSIRIDGTDLRQLDLEELRTIVAVAFEDTTLFSSSVRDNVLLGAEPASSAEADQLLAQALDVAQADFVYSLPEGTDTLIGEEGLSLSGGQRQRVALARAIAARPTVLIMDDPLSALDVRTEELVEGRLREVLADTTTLVVAHRPSTVSLADRVALMEDGRISAVGTHAELLAGNDHYRYVIASLPTEPEDLDSPLEDGPLPADAADDAAGALEAPRLDDEEIIR